MSLNAVDIKNIIKELSIIVNDAKVEKIYQHTKDDFIISLYKSASYKLYFNFTSGMTRLHLIKARMTAMPQPSAFVMLMRKYLKNSIISNIEQINDDRVIKIAFRTKTTEFYIIAELMDKLSNIYFLSSNYKILGFLRPVKNIKKGQVFEYPQKSNMDINTLKPSVETQESMMFNEAVEKKYQTKTETKTTSELNKILTQPLKKEIKKLKKLIKNMSKDLEKAGDPKTFNHYGQLLQTHFHKLKKGLDSITLKDYENNCDTKVLLNPELSPQDNIAVYFKKARKSRSAMKIIPKNIEKTNQKINTLQNILNELTEVEDRDTAITIIERIKSQKPYLYNKFLEKIHKALLSGDIKNAAINKKASDKLPYRYFISSTGQKIFVARNNRENEELTFKFANGNDDWIHTRDYPGSHVLITLGKHEEIDGKTLTEACQLALHFSKAKNNNSAEVYYTKRKYLTKPKNAPLGKVNLSNYKIINVVADKKILDRILERKGE